MYMTLNRSSLVLNRSFVGKKRLIDIIYPETILQVFWLESPEPKKALTGILASEHLLQDF